jgi:streptogrisin D
MKPVGHFNLRKCFCALGRVALIVSSTGIATSEATAAAGATDGKTLMSASRNTAGDLEWWLAKRQPDVFGGVLIDETTGVVRVFVKGGKDQTALLERELQELLRWEATALMSESGQAPPDDSPRLPVELVTSAKSYRQLSKIAARASGVGLSGKDEGEVKDPTWAAQTGGRVNLVQPDYARGVVVVGVEASTEDDRSVGRRQFSGDVEVVESQPIRPMARMSDNSPHFGGSNIAGIGDCSTAFTVALGGSRKMLTAGHCGPVGTSWVSSVNSYSFGSTQGRNYCGGCSDDGYLGGSTYNPYVYTGSAPTNYPQWSPSDWDNSTTYAAVKGASVPGPSVALIASGSRSGQSGGYLVPVNNALACRNQTLDGITVWVCNTRTSSRQAGALIKPGDSGGAVFVYESNLLKAVGIIIGGDNSFSMTYTPIGVALNDFGFSLVTA